MKINKGSAIIFCIGILSLASILGITFVQNAVKERTASINYEDHFRAHLILQAGIEHAVKGLKQWCETHTYSWDGDVAPWFYYKIDGSNKISAAGTSLDDVARGTNQVMLSFYQGLTPYTYNSKPYSGIANSNGLGTYEPYGDTYMLKVMDCASQINLNVHYINESGLTRPDGYSNNNVPLRIILENLLKAIANDHLTSYSISNAKAIANLIIDERNKRPGEKFNSKRDLLAINYSQIQTNLLSERFFKDIKDYVCVYSWQDNDQYWRKTHINSIINPSFYNRFNPVYNTLGNEPPIQQEARSPININTASKPVLVAVIAPLAGVLYSENNTVETVSLSYTEAQKVADEIVKNRPFQNINKLEEVVDQIIIDDTNSRQNLLKKDLIKANFNPNMWPIQINPTPIVYNTQGKAYFNYQIDKFHLCYLTNGFNEWSGHTTEFCFSSMGYFEIEGLARITSNGGMERARAYGEAVAKLYDVFRHTSQDSFVNEDRDAYEYPGYSERFIPDEVILAGNGVSTTVLQGTSMNIQGDIHVNGSLSINGNVTVNGNVNASNGITGGDSTATNLNPTAPQQYIPIVEPSDYKYRADYIYTKNGVYNSSGTMVHNWGTNGNTCNNIKYQGLDATGKCIFSVQGLSTVASPPGTYYFEGDIKITGTGDPTPWNASLFATGNIDIGGNASISGAGKDVSLIAGGNISLTGTSGATYSGLMFANGSIEVGGDARIEGAFVGKNVNIGDQNNLHGSPTIIYQKPNDSFITIPPTAGSGKRGDTIISYPHADFNLNYTRCKYSGYLMLGTVNGADLTGIPPIFRVGFDAEGDTTPYSHFKADLGYGNKGLKRDPNSTDAGPYLTANGDMVGPILYTFLPWPQGNDPIPPIPPLHAGFQGYPARASRLPHLFPDGCYSDYNSIPAYEVLNNMPNTEGTVSLWFKPYSKEFSKRSHHLLSLTRSNPARCFEIIYIGEDSNNINYPPKTLHFRFDTSDNFGNRKRRHIYIPDPYIKPHGWNHLYITWNLLGNNTDQSIRLYLNEQLAGKTVTVKGRENSIPETFSLGNNENISVNNPGLRLGEWMASSSAFNSYNNGLFPAFSPEVTYDEVLVYPKFGALDPPPSRLYNIGRYYNNENPSHTRDASKLATFSLNKEKRFNINSRKIATVTWTVYLPKTKSCISSDLYNLLTNQEEWNVQFDIKGYNSRTDKYEAGETLSSFLASTNSTKDKSYTHNVMGATSYNYVGYGITISHTLGNVPILESPVIDDITITVMNRNVIIKSWDEFD